MAKRLTDSEKWKDEWFLSLDNDSRMIWIYILDNCTHAGLLKKNLKMMNFCCNTSLTDEKIREIFEGRLVDLGDTYFIPKFLKFQYGNLSSEKPVIVSVRKELSLHKDYKMIAESLPNDCQIIKSKSKDKSKDKDILFKECEFLNFESFRDAFVLNPKYQKYDVNFYYEAVKNWSESTGAKKKDWIATARGFAHRDDKENKAKLKPISYKSENNGKHDPSTAHL